MAPIRKLTILALLSFLFATKSLAQSAGTVELGLDGSVSVAAIDDVSRTLVTIGLPARHLRVGFFAVEQFQIETSLGFTVESVRDDVPEDRPELDDSASATGTELHLSFAYHVVRAESSSTPFIRAGAIVAALNTRGSTNAQFGIDGGVGLKLRSGQNWGTRFEVSVARLFERDRLRGSWGPALTFGFSYFVN